MAAGTSGAPAASAIRAAGVRTGLVLLSQPLPPPRALREHDHDLAVPYELDRAADGLEVGLAATIGESAAASQDRLQNRVEQLALRHEAQLPPGKERQREGPGVEVRRVVGGEDETALRQVLEPTRAQAEAELDERPADCGGKQVNGRHGAKGSFHFRLACVFLRRASPSLLCLA